MRRCAGTRVGAALLSLYVVSGFSRPTLAQQAPAPTAKQIEAGAATYKKAGCFQCHVNEAQGGANGPRLGPNPIPFARFTQYVRKPAGEMPPYTAKVLPDHELADIFVWLRSLPPPPAVDSLRVLSPER